MDGCVCVCVCVCVSTYISQLSAQWTQINHGISSAQTLISKYLSPLSNHGHDCMRNRLTPELVTRESIRGAWIILREAGGGMGWGQCSKNDTVMSKEHRLVKSETSNHQNK